MKKFKIWILAALAAALCLLCGCSAEDFALPHEVQLAVGQQCALAGELRFTGSLADITPQDRAEFAQAVTDAVVHIASTDPSVATVDQDGNVTAVAPGTATVLVSCVDLDFYAEVNIDVVEAATPESAAPATPETATPESAAPATSETAATPETAATATPETAAPTAPETATPESAAPATPETAAPATPETASPESAATPESAAPATPESAATPETAKTATPETAVPPKTPKATDPPATAQEETTAAEEKTREPFREFLKKVGSTVADFFGGLFDRGKTTG